MAAQRAVAERLKELRPDHDFVSNKKGQQTPDVSGKLDGKTVARIEVKSAQGLKGLTTVYDKTVGAEESTRFDDLARALAKAAKIDIPQGASPVGAFIIGLGGELGQEREVRPELQRNLDNPAYGGYSHKLISKKGDDHLFEPEPGDAGLTDGKNGQLHVLKRVKGGGYKAFKTVLRRPEGLFTKSQPRWWSTSGKIPAKGGISKDSASIGAALKNILDHFREDSDDYFILVDGSTIYPFIVGDDPLDLASLGVPKLSASYIDRAGLSTYGLAGPGKVRLALKMKFTPTKQLKVDLKSKLKSELIPKSSPDRQPADSRSPIPTTMARTDQGRIDRETRRDPYANLSASLKRAVLKRLLREAQKN